MDQKFNIITHLQENNVPYAVCYETFESPFFDGAVKMWFIAVKYEFLEFLKGLKKTKDKANRCYMIDFNKATMDFFNKNINNYHIAYQHNRDKIYEPNDINFRLKQ